MAITKIQAGALPADVITTAAIDDASITHAKLHTTMDLSSKTVTLPTLSTLNTTGNVGIGTSSPKRHLHLNNPAALTTKIQITNLTTGASTDGDGFQLGISNDGTANIEQRENLDMAFATNNAERMRIDSSGNVGIGTDSPSTSLDVVRAGVQPLRVQSTSGTEVQIHMVNTGGNVQLEAHNNNFNIDADAVGIGTTSPGAKLHVDVGAPSSTDQTLGRFQSQDSRQIGFVWDDSQSTLGIATLTNHKMVFHTNGNSNPRMTIDTSGKVGIGTTSPAEKLQIEGTNPRIYVNGDSNSYYPSIRVDGVNGGISLGTYYGGNISGENSLTFLTGSSETDGGSARLQIRGDNDIEIRNLQSGAGGNDTNALYWKIQNSANTGQYARLGGIKAETVSNWGGKLKFYTKPANGTPNDNVTEQMVIDQSGRVTMPYQPAFRAGYTSGSTVTNNVNNKHPFTSVAINRGNNYSGPNARFTAPVAGLYRFSACFWVNANNNCDFAPRLNGSSWISSAPNSDAIIFVQKADSYIQNLSGTFMLELQANDYVELQSRNYTSNYYAGHSWWEGHLIG